MKKMNAQALRKLIIPLSSLLIILVFISVNYSQIGCINRDNVFYGLLPKQKTTYYIFVGITGAQKTQIETAFTTWQSTNTNPSENCSGVRFAPGPAPGGGVTITISNRALNNVAARSVGDYTTPGNEIYSAEIFFDLNYKILEDGVVVNYYDASKPDSYGTIFTKMALHEIGHLMGLSHYNTGHPDICRDKTPDNPLDDQMQLSSVMNDGCGPNDSRSNIPMAPTRCENSRINAIYCAPTPTPTPTPTPNEACRDECASNGEINCEYGGCPFGTEPNGYGQCCSSYSPILLDINGNGFNLTNAAEGVFFDLNNDRVEEKLSWTVTDSDDVWLALDRNDNGTIDNGQELFGNFTPQPEPPAGEERQGFLALAEHDKAANGGNDDGEITSQDTIFSRLQLWQDTNHNGISEAGELHTMAEMGLRSIELNYRESRRQDEHGNRFKYRAQVKDAKGSKINRWAWDVFLVSVNRSATNISSTNRKFNLLSSLGFAGLLVSKSNFRCGG